MRSFKRIGSCIPYMALALVAFFSVIDIALVNCYPLNSGVVLRESVHGRMDIMARSNIGAFSGIIAGLTDRRRALDVRSAMTD